MAAIFFLSYVGSRAQDTIAEFIERVFGYAPGSTQSNSLLFFLYVGTFLAIVFASYAGRTLDFGGKPMRPPEGTILSLLVGLLNGYLVAGTIWYYANLFGYPFMNVDTAAILVHGRFHADLSAAECRVEPGGVDGAGGPVDLAACAWMMGIVL